MNGQELVINENLYKHDPAIHNFYAARQVLPCILQLKTILSVLDVGCGTGTWLSVARELGVEAIMGVDGVDLNESELKISGTDFRQVNLSAELNLNRKFDLVICLEVAEHLPESSAITLVNTLTRHGEFILFSAAVPGQGGQNHLNEQWPLYWVNLFATRGYVACDFLRRKFWDNSEVEWWYRQNLLIFCSEQELELLKLKKADLVPALVHPALFEEKLAEIIALQSLIEREIHRPSLKRGLKSLFKAVFK